MLSFFRKKSLEDSTPSADQTITSTSNRVNSTTTCNVQLKDSDASTLVRELGYNNLTELKETIYGMRIIFSVLALFELLFLCNYQIC